MSRAKAKAAAAPLPMQVTELRELVDPTEAERIHVLYWGRDQIMYCQPCGNYLYREAPAADGGPIVLTLLRYTDRQDSRNDPLAVLSGQLGFRVIPAGQNPPAHDTHTGKLTDQPMAVTLAPVPGR
jgi:hypothetical protein